MDSSVSFWNSIHSIISDRPLSNARAAWYGDVYTQYMSLKQTMSSELLSSSYSNCMLIGMAQVL